MQCIDNEQSIVIHLSLWKNTIKSIMGITVKKEKKGTNKLRVVTKIVSFSQDTLDY